MQSEFETYYISRVESEQTSIDVKRLNLFYSQKQALFDISCEIRRKGVTAFIGPSGCGKSTLLRCFNRMNDMIPDIRIEGTVHVDGENIYAAKQQLEALRTKVGMVFQKSNPFPMSIFDNVAFGPRMIGTSKDLDLQQVVRDCLEKADLWNEVKDRLNTQGTSLSGGQQQRLCIARALAVSPQILLMDEPCSALDPISTARIEELILQLRKDYTIAIVTHNMQQARRIADDTAFMYLGRMLEKDKSHKIFEEPHNAKTRAYVRGHFG